jgi:hypothetical protein
MWAEVYRAGQESKPYSPATNSKGRMPAPSILDFDEARIFGTETPLD